GEDSRGGARRTRGDRVRTSRPAQRRPESGLRRTPQEVRPKPDATDKGISLATVRIYKVAELLGTTSQEVTALLKRDHGIEVKSAPRTIAEVGGRQFVERLARQRNISLPGGDMFAETPVAKGKKPAPKKPAEPVKTAAPALPPPRLLQAARARAQALGEI